MDAELEAVLLSKAAQLGLPAEWVSLLDELDPERRQALRVRSTVANSHAAQVGRGKTRRFCFGCAVCDSCLHGGASLLGRSLANAHAA